MGANGHCQLPRFWLKALRYRNFEMGANPLLLLHTTQCIFFALRDKDQGSHENIGKDDGS